MSNSLVLLESLVDEAMDVGKGDSPSQEAVHRDVVGGRQHRRHRPAASAGSQGEVKAGIATGRERRETESAGFFQAKSRPGIAASGRVKQRVLDWQAHISRSQRRPNRAVHELGHRVHEAFAMEEHVNLLVG